MRALMLPLLLLLALPLALLPPASCALVVSSVKMRRSNPVVSAVVDGAAVDLIATTDVDGVWVCMDLNAAKSAANLSVDFGGARCLL